MHAALEELLAPVLGAPDEWERKAAERRELTATDPVADMLVVLARDLRTRLARIDAAAATLIPEQFAALPSVRTTPQTVRRWCRAGLLPGARLTPRGWEIPADATPPRGRATARPRLAPADVRAA